MVAQLGEGRGIVTPEAVLLDFDAAGLGSRVVAFVLDLLVLVGTLLGVAFAVSILSLGEGLGWLGVILFVVSVFAVIFGYPTASETLWHGRTIGKAAMGVRVVTVEGAPVRFRHAAVRAGLGIVDIYLTCGFVATVSMVVSPLHQRLGDLAAGTMVIRERSAIIGGRVGARWFPPPPGFEAFTAAVDPTGLRPADHAFARAALLRLPDLRPAGRRAALDAAERVITARTTIVRPPQMPVDAFVQAVVSAYQSRQDRVRADPGPPAEARPAGSGPQDRPGGGAARQDRPGDGSGPEDRPGGGFAPLS